MSIAMQLPAFLEADFSRLPAEVLDRCARITGRRIYLSGATGFFGKNVLAFFVFLQKRGVSFQVTAMSRSPDSFLAEHPWCRELPWLAWQQGDATRAWTGNGRYDLLLHAATPTSPEAHSHALDLFESIVASTRCAMDFAVIHGVQRVLLTGSGAEYGEIPEKHAHGIPESSNLACDSGKPGSAYGEGKRSGETLAALRGQRDGIAIINTRCFAFVGPGQPLSGHYAVSSFIRNALNGESVRLSSQGESLRSYLYGADLAVWLLILLLEAQGGQRVNVGSDAALPVSKLACLVRDVVNPSGQVDIGTDASPTERRFYVPSIDTARELGLEAWTPLRLSIERTAEWYRNEARLHSKSQ